MLIGFGTQHGMYSADDIRSFHFTIIHFSFVSTRSSDCFTSSATSSNSSIVSNVYRILIL